jgi:hypothetical protein
VGQGRIQLVERILGLGGPGKALVLLEEAVEGQALFVEPRDKAAQGGKAPRHFLYPFEIPNWTHFLEGCNLFGVGLDASLGDYVS